MSAICLSCNHDALINVRPYRTNTPFGRAVFGETSLNSCGRCGLVQAAPPPAPEKLTDYYTVDYRTGGYAGSDVADVSQFPKDNLFYFNRGQSIADLLSTYVRKENPQILDIGAGYGHILHALGQRYSHSTRMAVEFSDVCAKHLMSLGVQVFTEPVEEVLPRIGRRFDLVVMSHSLEHVLNPLTVLQLIKASLVPGGILYVEVPNIPVESLLRYPDHMWAPRYDEPHITFFSRSTLRDLLESSGFEVKFCDTAGAEYRYISPVRFRLPPVRSFVQRLVPPKLFLNLRKLNFTKPLRVQEREETFYQYGGFRLWIRSVSHA
jgi:SAM-dependent methyltransferase